MRTVETEMLSAVIFDVDGTLIDSVDRHAHAWQDAFRHFGHDFPYEKVRFEIGKGGDQLLPEFLSEDEIKRRGKEIQEYRSKVFKENYRQGIQPFPKVRELFEAVLARGLKIALASSAKGDELKQYEKLAHIDDLVEVETSSADAEKSKPHPDILEAALDRLGKGIEAENALMIGDTPHDAEAANRAHVRTIGVLCGGFSEECLREAGCIAIYRDPADLLAHLEEWAR